MSDVYDGPFGGYTDVTNVVSAAAQTEIIAQVNKLKALLPNQTAATSVSGAHPDFDQIPPHTASKFRTECDALIAAIDAAPTA